MSLLLDALGWIGNIGFVIACVPMAWKTVRKGADIGNPRSTMWLFAVANSAFCSFLLGTYGFHWLFTLNLVESSSWLIALWYHYWPRPGPEYAPQWMIDAVQDCTREAYHEGPCNGWPTAQCPGYAAWLLHRTREVLHG